MLTAWPTPLRLQHFASFCNMTLYDSFRMHRWLFRWLSCIRIESCHVTSIWPLHWPAIFAGAGLCVGWTLLLAPWRPRQISVNRQNGRPLEKLLEKIRINWRGLRKSTEVYRMGPPLDSVQLPDFSGFMVDRTIVNRGNIGVIMVYKATYNWGAPSCTESELSELSIFLSVSVFEVSVAQGAGS